MNNLFLILGYIAWIGTVNRILNCSAFQSHQDTYHQDTWLRHTSEPPGYLVVAHFRATRILDILSLWCISEPPGYLILHL